MKKDKLLFLIFGITIFITGVTLTYFRSIHSVIWSDESYIWEGAHRIINGEKPYSDFWTVVPPLIFYSTAMVFKIFGEQIIWLKLISAIKVGLVGLMVFRITSLWSSKNVALIGSLITIFSSYISMPIPWYDSETHFVGVIGLWIFVENYKKNLNIYAILSGIFIGLTIYGKYNISAAYFFSIVLLMLLTTRNKVDKNKIILIGITLGIVVPFFVLQLDLKQFAHWTLLRGGENLLSGRLRLIFPWWGPEINPKSMYYNAPMIWTTLSFAFFYQQFRKNKLQKEHLLPLSFSIISIVIPVSVIMGGNNWMQGHFLIGIGWTVAIYAVDNYYFRDNVGKVVKTITFVIGICFLSSAFYLNFIKSYTLQFALKDYESFDYKLKSDRYSGLWTNKSYGQELDQLIEYFDINCPPNEDILCFPLGGEIQFGIDKVRPAQPLQFYVGFQINSEDENQIITSLINSFPLYIVLQKNAFHKVEKLSAQYQLKKLPQISNFIKKNYEEVNDISLSNYVVYIRSGSSF